MRDPEVDGERFHILEAYTKVTRELLLREELELRGISYMSLHIFASWLAYLL